MCFTIIGTLLLNDSYRMFKKSSYPKEIMYFLPNFGKVKFRNSYHIEANTMGITTRKMYHFTCHCVLKMLKSQWRGDEPKFICHVKGGYIVISKSKVFFESVQGKN